MMVAINEQFIARHPEHGADAHCTKHMIADVRVKAEARTVTVVICTDGMDLDNEIVLPSGYDGSYYMGPGTGKSGGVRSVYLDHDYGALIGTCRSIKSLPNRLIATDYISKTPLGEDVMVMLGEDVLRGSSIGYRPVAQRRPTEDEKREHGSDLRNVVTKWLMLEHSFTSRPCNPEALVLAVNKNRIRRSSAVLMGLPDTPVRKFFPIAPSPSRIVIGEESPRPRRLVIG